MKVLQDLMLGYWTEYRKIPFICGLPIQQCPQHAWSTLIPRKKKLEKKFHCCWMERKPNTKLYDGWGSWRINSAELAFKSGRGFDNWGMGYLKSCLGCSVRIQQSLQPRSWSEGSHLNWHNISCLDTKAPFFSLTLLANWGRSLLSCLL